MTRGTKIDPRDCQPRTATPSRISLLPPLVLSLRLLYSFIPPRGPCLSVALSSLCLSPLLLVVLSPLYFLPFNLPMCVPPTPCRVSPVCIYLFSSWLRCFVSWFLSYVLGRCCLFVSFASSVSLSIIISSSFFSPCLCFFFLFVLYPVSSVFFLGFFFTFS